MAVIARTVNVVLFDQAWADLQYWMGHDRGVLAKLVALIEQCKRDPFRGIGRPEPLKNDLRGWWSRRIDQEHRLVYRVTGKGDEQRLEIAQCRFHYD